MNLTKLNTDPCTSVSPTFNTSCDIKQVPIGMISPRNLTIKKLSFAILVALSLTPVLAFATQTPKNIDEISEAVANQNKQNQIPAYQLLTAKQIENQLNKTITPIADNAKFDVPIAQFGSDISPIGLDNDFNFDNDLDFNNNWNLDEVNTDKLQSNHTIDVIEPANQLSESLKEDELGNNNLLDGFNTNKEKNNSKIGNQTGNVLEQGYANVFNDGFLPLARVNANIYIRSTNPNDKSKSKFIALDVTKQPAKNIKAALDDFPVEMVTDFVAALPLIRVAATDAAEAVGYYDVKMKFEQPNRKQLNVLIESLGKPVIVDSQVVKINGDGEVFAPYQDVRDSAKPQEGEVFNHRQYSQTKGAIEAVSSQYGYFDGDWLENSVDIILPDNLADMSLVYESGKRYSFDDVVFFTRDKNTGELTTDPDKLPLKKELLQQLVNYQINEGYDSAKITELTNDLFATRYFDGIDVETVLPQQKSLMSADDSVSFENSNGTQEIQASELDLLFNGDDLNGKSAEEAPLEFKIDETISQKLKDVQAKADRLYNAPDNAVLDEVPYEAKSILGQLSNAISHVATKILPDDEGQPFNATDGQIELSGKQTPQQVQNSKKIPTYVMVTADNPRDAELGLGYGTDTGFRVKAKFDNNLLNKDGYKAGVAGFWSNIENGATAYVSRPWKHPLDDTLNSSISYKQEVIDQGEGNFDLTTNSYLGSLSRNIISDNHWSRNYSLRYRRDDLKTGVAQSEYQDLPVRFTSGNPKQQALLIGYALNKTVADNVSNPKEGWQQYYSLEAGVEGALSDTNLVIAKAGTSGIYSFGEDDKHQVLGKLDTGYLWSNDFKDVPYQLRFFAGGDQSIRGYDYKSLSPLENGYLTGGEILAVGTAEYNYEFIPGLRAAIFTDVGNAYDKDFKADTKVGTGLGIRWASPIGPVRLDVAAGVTEDNIPIRLHFFIGSPL